MPTITIDSLKQADCSGQAVNYAKVDHTKGLCVSGTYDGEDNVIVTLSTVDSMTVTNIHLNTSKSAQEKITSKTTLVLKQLRKMIISDFKKPKQPELADSQKKPTTPPIKIPIVPLDWDEILAAGILAANTQYILTASDTLNLATPVHITIWTI